MDEWVVVSVIVVLVGLFFTVGKPVVNLNTTLVRLEEKLNRVTDKFEMFEKHNEAEHKYITDVLDKHGETLDIHEKRLSDIERT